MGVYQDGTTMAETTRRRRFIGIDTRGLFSMQLWIWKAHRENVGLREKETRYGCMAWAHIGLLTCAANSLQYRWRNALAAESKIGALTAYHLSAKPSRKAPPRSHQV